MQEQKKNFNLNKALFRQFFQYRPFLLKPLILKILEKKKHTKKKISVIIIIKIIPNNIFLTLINSKTKKILFVSSSGKENLKVSKKRLKFISKLYLQICFKKIYKYLKEKTILFKISAPIKIRKNVIRLITTSLKKNIIFFYTPPMKVYNGCKAKKARRIKKKSFKIFK
jgi:ribosomal protein S11